MSKSGQGKTPVSTQRWWAWLVCVLILGWGAHCAPNTDPTEPAPLEPSASEPTSSEPTTPDEGKAAISATPGNQVYFSSKWSTEATFYRFPFPSDMRLSASGGPDVTGFPNQNANEKVANVVGIIPQHKGFPLAPIAYFQFQKALAKRKSQDLIEASADAPVMLLDIDPKSPQRGTLYPIVTTELPSDGYVPDHLLAVGVYPGVILHQERTYAFVVMRQYNDAQGESLGAPKVLNELKAGHTPEGAWGEKLKTLYEPLWETLKQKQISLDDVAAATVFTTGNVVSDTERISSALRQKNTLEIKGLKLDPSDGNHERFCELHGTMSVPIYQKGTPPYDTEGLFEMGADGLPIKQRDKTIPIVITIPKKPMPPAGYSLTMYIHGSGGVASQVVDRGPRVPKTDPRYRGQGPSHILAPYALATASMAMPLNPERVPGASTLAYFNLNNLKIFRDTYRQGVIELRMFLDALLKLKIPPDTLGACQGPTLPQGESAFFFADKRLTLMGQSMGGTYSNLMAAVEPRFKAVVPTGTGGYWGYFAYKNNLAYLNQAIITSLLGFENALDHLHPVMNALQTAWEAADPFTHSAYLSRRKLKPDFPVRSIYEPVGLNDTYFTTTLLDLMAAGYGNQQAGPDVWPGMQIRLGALGLDGKATYPVKNNRRGADDTPYTGVVVQFKPDQATNNGHIVAFQRDDVKHQYSCFLSTFVSTGIGVVPAPAALDTPCP